MNKKDLKVVGTILAIIAAIGGAIILALETLF